MSVAPHEHAITITVNNRPDVLARIAATFSARGFNIESISANVTNNPAVTKIIITTLAAPGTIEKIVKQLNRLVDVLDARRLSRSRAVRREMILARIAPVPEREDEIQDLMKSYGGKTIGGESGSPVLEFTGNKETVTEIMDRLCELGAEDITRTGVIAMDRFSS